MVAGSFVTTFDPADVFGVPPDGPNGVINTDFAATVLVNHPDLLAPFSFARGEHYSDGRNYLLIVSQSQVGEVFNHFHGRFVLNDAMDVTGAIFLEHLRFQGSAQIDYWHSSADIAVTPCRTPSAR